MIIKNGNLFTENAEFVKQDIALCGDKIDAIGENLCGEEVFDATDCYVIPGFVDIHIHGAYGSDFCDNSENDINTIAKYLVSQGVTSFWAQQWLLMNLSSQVFSKLPTHFSTK